MEGAGGSDAKSLSFSTLRQEEGRFRLAVPHTPVPGRELHMRSSPTRTLARKPEWQQKSEAITWNQVTTTAKHTVMENEDWGNSLENSFTEKQDTKA